MNILFLSPHLSTGGMPAFLLKRVEELHKLIRIYVVEYSNFSPIYVVQKDKIKALLPENQFFTLGEDKMELIDIIKNNNIDVVHVEEMVEGFESFNRMPLELINSLYANDRTWRMVETCHNVWFKPNELKKMQPDAYAFVTPYHLLTFAGMNTVKKVIEFPIEKQNAPFRNIEKAQLGFDIDKKHVLNVGLWTSGKNQAEGIEIARKYPNMDFHFVGNQASNFKDYWEPLMKDLPDNVKVWGERADVDRFMKAADIFMFNSTWECNPLVLREAIGYGLPIIARDLPQYGDMFTKYINPIDTDLNTLQATYDIPEQGITFAQEHIYLYNLITSMPISEQSPIKSSATITQHFVDHPFLEITGEGDADYKVQFIDENGSITYENTIKINSWVKLNRRYYTKWTTKVWENGTLIHHNVLDLTGKRVLLCLESKSLGDTIAWAPYALEFQKKHNCKVILSSFLNNILDYPELELVEPGTTVPNLYAQYRIGWFFDKDREPIYPATIPLQQTASNILALPFKEIHPRIAFTPTERPMVNEYICISTKSTAQCKHWYYWPELIQQLKSWGYRVFEMSQEADDYGAETLEDKSLQNVMNYLHHAELFIGLSSGISWLNWGIGKHTVMISNFTTEDHEFQENCTRITNKEACNGCWNNPNFKFDKGDWDWCPIWKNTPRQFECHKSISVNDVAMAVLSLN